MRRESHVRFGGRAGETHRSKDGRAFRSDPYTYVPTWAGFLFLAVVIDAFSRRVVAWSMANHLRAELVLEALNVALRQLRPSLRSRRPIYVVRLRETLPRDGRRTIHGFGRRLL